MYDGALTGDLHAAGRSPEDDPRQAIAEAPACAARYRSAA